MDKLKIVLDWILARSLPGKVLALIAMILIAIVILFFSSCSSSFYSRLPDISGNKFGSEGTVSKEKNITKNTKWFFKPDSLTDNTD